MNHILRNRTIGALAALATWGLFFAVDSFEGAATARLREAAECRSMRRQLEGAAEMYCLDRNVQLRDSVLAAGAIVAHAELTRLGYERAPARCGERLIELCGEAAYCPEHGLSGAAGRCESEPSLVRVVLALMASYGAHVVFPIAFWLAIGARALRWGRRYRTGQARLLPASWVITLNLMCPPAGLIALGRFRGAAVQAALIGAAMACGIPLYLATLPAAAWAAVARLAEEAR